MRTLKPLHSQCAFVKTLLSAHVSARCFTAGTWIVTTFVVHMFKSLLMQCACKSLRSPCSAHTYTIVLTMVLWSVGYIRSAFPSIHCGRSGCVGGTALAERVYKPLLEQCACGPLLSQLCTRSLRPHVQITHCPNSELSAALAAAAFAEGMLKSLSFQCAC